MLNRALKYLFFVALRLLSFHFAKSKGTTFWLDKPTLHTPHSPL
jgi:hypothetical protein